MPGPPPTPLKVVVLRGNPGKRRLRAEVEPSCTAQCPDRPAFLTGYAADEWDRVAGELRRLGLLTVLDISVFAIYCATYARWRTAEASLARMDQDDMRRNPLARIARHAANDMVRVSGLFGMSPVARARLAGGLGGQPKGKFDGLIA